MNINAFFEHQENARHCVHAKTEKDARFIMQWFIERGKPYWNGGVRRDSVTHWESYRENTVYYPDGMFGSVRYAERNHHTVYETSDFSARDMTRNEVFA